MLSWGGGRTWSGVGTKSCIGWFDQMEAPSTRELGTNPDGLGFMTSVICVLMKIIIPLDANYDICETFFLSV